MDSDRRVLNIRLETIAENSLGGAKLERALGCLSREPADLSPETYHVLSRVGIWAREAAQGLEKGDISMSEVIAQLNVLADAGEIAFALWLKPES